MMVAFALLAMVMAAGCYFGTVVHKTTSVTPGFDLSTPYTGAVAVSKNHEWVFTAGGTPAGLKKLYTVSATTGQVFKQTQILAAWNVVGADSAQLPNQSEHFWFLLSDGQIKRIDKSHNLLEAFAGPVVANTYRDISVDADGNIFVYVAVGAAGRLYRRDVATLAWTFVAAKPAGGNLPTLARMSACPATGAVAVLDLVTKQHIYTYNNDLTPNAGLSPTLSAPFQAAFDIEFLGGFAFVSARATFVFAATTVTNDYLVSIDTSTGATKDSEKLPGFGLALEPVANDIGFLWTTGFQKNVDDGLYYYFHKIQLTKDP
jgi:hypothetical protein